MQELFVLGRSRSSISAVFRHVIESQHIFFYALDVCILLACRCILSALFLYALLCAWPYASASFFVFVCSILLMQERFSAALDHFRRCIVTYSSAAAYFCFCSNNRCLVHAWIISCQHYCWVRCNMRLTFCSLAPFCVCVRRGWSRSGSRLPSTISAKSSKLILPPLLRPGAWWVTAKTFKKKKGACHALRYLWLVIFFVKLNKCFSSVEHHFNFLR